MRKENITRNTDVIIENIQCANDNITVAKNLYKSALIQLAGDEVEILLTIIIVTFPGVKQVYGKLSYVAGLFAVYDEDTKRHYVFSHDQIIEMHVGDDGDVWVEVISN